MSMVEAKIELIRNMIRESKYLVVICGGDMLRECGHYRLRDQERAYDIEAEYGYSPEEMYSSAFYNTRTESFFRFYKKEILEQEPEPGPAYKAIAKLEQEGIVKAVVARSVYGMFQRAGCKNVLEPHGSIYKNKCPRCQKEYSKDYMKAAKKVPLCEKCMVPVRPAVRLFGEMVDNGVMTKVADEISKADVLLVVGAQLAPEFCENNLRYYKGDKMILVGNRKKYLDAQADYTLYGPLNEVMPELAK